MEKISAGNRQSAVVSPETVNYKIDKRSTILDNALVTRERLPLFILLKWLGKCESV